MMRRSISRCCCLLAILAPSARLGSQTARTSMDTIRVGNLIAVLQPGVDTLETTFEARGPSGSMDKRTNVSVVRRTRETLGGDPVLHVRFGGEGQGPSFDFYLDPRTM